jgi:hypothetical protein
MENFVAIYRWRSGSFYPLVRDQRDGLYACHSRRLFRDFLGAVTLDMPVSFAKVAESLAFFFIFWICWLASRGDRVHFVDLHRDRRRCRGWSGCYDRASWTINFFLLTVLWILSLHSWYLLRLGQDTLWTERPPSPIYYMPYPRLYCTTYACISTC